MHTKTVKLPDASLDIRCNVIKPRTDMGGNTKFLKQSRHPYCPFRKFCIFLNGESPETVLAERDYLSKRVDELEFAMDFTNRQVIQLQERIKELEDDKSQLETELVQALRAPFTKYEKKELPENPKKRGRRLAIPDGSARSQSISTSTLMFTWILVHIVEVKIFPRAITLRNTLRKTLNPVRWWSLVLFTTFIGIRRTRRLSTAGIPNAYIGPEARAKATFLRHDIKTSYGYTSKTLQYLCDLTVTPGAIVGFDHKFSRDGGPLYDALKGTLPDTSCIHADETGWKRDWLWIFTNPDIAFFHIDKSRGSTVVRDHLVDFYNGILITDFYSSYRSLVPAFGKQKCCSHLLRDVKELLDKGLLEDPDAETFLNELKQLVQDAIDLHKLYSKLTTEEWRSGKKEILKRFRKLYRISPLSHKEVDNIRKRLITHKNELFVFLKFPQVSPTNNHAERGLRGLVIFRKITFGSMTEKGKKNVALIMTIIKTAKLRMLNPVKVFQAIAAKGTTPELLEQFGIPTSMPQAP